MDEAIFKKIIDIKQPNMSVQQIVEEYYFRSSTNDSSIDIIIISSIRKNIISISTIIISSSTSSIIIRRNITTTIIINTISNNKQMWRHQFLSITVHHSETSELFQPETTTWIELIFHVLLSANSNIYQIPEGLVADKVWYNK